MAEAALYSFKIEYEIPPLRAIYTDIIDNCDCRATAVACLQSERNALINIRKVEKVAPEE